MEATRLPGPTPPIRLRLTQRMIAQQAAATEASGPVAAYQNAERAEHVTKKLAFSCCLASFPPSCPYIRWAKTKGFDMAIGLDLTTIITVGSVTTLIFGIMFGVLV